MLCCFENCFCSLQAARNNSLQLTDDVVNEALLHIEKQLSQHRKSLAMFPGMPLPTATSTLSSIEASERAYDCTTLAASVAANLPKLNAGQKDVYDAVMAAMTTQPSAQVRGLFAVMLTIPNVTTPQLTQP